MVHNDYGSRTSLNSQGCLVLDGNLLETMHDQIAEARRQVVKYNADIAAYNAKYNTSLHQHKCPP
jgi:hypothetical protein